MGDLPIEVDCAIFGLLAQIVWNSPGSPYEHLFHGIYPSIWHKIQICTFLCLFIRWIGQFERLLRADERDILAGLGRSFEISLEERTPRHVTLSSYLLSRSISLFLLPVLWPNNSSAVVYGPWSPWKRDRRSFPYSRPVAHQFRVSRWSSFTPSVSSLHNFSIQKCWQSFRSTFDK